MPFADQGQGSIGGAIPRVNVRIEKEAQMIGYIEGILLRDASGCPKVVSDADEVATLPATMHPFAARDIGHRYAELDRAADKGAYVVLTIENDPDPSIVEIDEISPADPEAIDKARLALSSRLAA